MTQRLASTLIIAATLDDDLFDTALRYIGGAVVVILATAGLSVYTDIGFYPILAVLVLLIAGIQIGRRIDS